jgi:hypothetical protein
MSVSLIDGHIDEPKITCKDCIHYDICVFHTKGNENEKCQHFKNKAEIERLKDTLKIYHNYNPAIKHAKAEAVKEFAERLIHKIVNTPSKFPSKYFMYRDGIKFRQDEIIEIIQGMVGER